MEESNSTPYQLAEDFLLDESFCDYCRNKSATAQHYWNNWLEEHPDKAELFQDAVQLFHLVSGYDPAASTAFGQFREALYAQPVTRKPTISYKYILAIAATVCGIAAGAWFFTRPQPGGMMAKATVYDTIHTLPEQVLHVRLPDNSQVVLNGNSTLIIPTSYKVDRKVRLTGEAYFDITPDAAHPFSVSSRNIETQVLGTSFMIQAYADIPTVKITLATGRIAVNHASNVQQLLPDQQLVISPEGNTLLAVNAADYRKWINGELFFHRQTLADITVLLQAHYNTRFVFSDKNMRQYLYTASFDRNVSLDKVLELLSYHRNIHFNHKGDTVWISKAG